jgi:hypothetical protein
VIRINTRADLDDLFGGQTEFEVSVEMIDQNGDLDILGAGHTVAEAVADARDQLRKWRTCEFCDGAAVGERKIDGRLQRVCEHCDRDAERAEQLADREADGHDPLGCPGCGGSCLRACR